VRIGREDWRELLPEDVAWVTEWLLAYAFRWVPIGPETGVYAAPSSDEAGKTWEVSVQVGRDVVPVRLPLRDLARLVHWCHSIRHIGALLHPPVWVRASMHSVQQSLRRSLRNVNPLNRMGYADGEVRGLDRGSPGR